MIEIDGKVLSRELFTESFVCDLAACKGACCVEGDSGAPLTEKEVKKVEEIYPQVKPYLTMDGIESIEKQGTSTVDPYDGESVTPLINNKACAYTVFDQNGTAKCGIEQAYREGAIDFQKPVSCHLYPIRITSYRKFDAVNYHKWGICDPARTCGAKLKVKVYHFCKSGLIRKYGKPFFEKIVEADKLMEKEEFIQNSGKS